MCICCFYLGESVFQQGDSFLFEIWVFLIYGLILLGMEVDIIINLVELDQRVF